MGESVSNINYERELRDVMKDIEWLEKEGYVRRTGKFKEGSPEFTITDAGREYVESVKKAAKLK